MAKAQRIPTAQAREPQVSITWVSSWTNIHEKAPQYGEKCIIAKENGMFYFATYVGKPDVWHNALGSCPEHVFIELTSTQWHTKVRAWAPYPPAPPITSPYGYEED